MNLKICQGTRLKSDKIDEVYLRLEPVLSGRGVLYGVAVVACKEDGEKYECGYLLKITEAGKIGLYNKVNPRLGFRLHFDGTIKLEE